jgi:sugar phosphate isomerase/epimerase
MARYDPHEGVRVLGPYVVHTHAKDALVHDDGRAQEVPLGDGWIDWPRYVGLLREAGFDGYFAIEREVGADPVGDITKAVRFLQSL